MADFFNKYQKLRREQHIDLADIQNRTKINLTYLRAIENGQFDVLPEAYMRLFLRAYVTELGADPDVASNELTEFLLRQDGKIPEDEETSKDSAAKTKETKSKPLSNKTDKAQVSNKFKEITTHSVKLKKVKPKNKGKSKWIAALIFILVWVFIIVIIRKITQENKESVDSQAAVNQIIEEGANFLNTQQLQLNFIESSWQEKALAETPPFLIKIVSTELVGFLTIKDSTDTMNTVLPAGDQFNVDFQNNLDIIFNHSNGLNIFVNGNSLPDIKSQATPVKVEFSVDPNVVTIRHYINGS